MSNIVSVRRKMFSRSVSHTYKLIRALLDSRNEHSSCRSHITRHTLALHSEKQWNYNSYIIPVSSSIDWYVNEGKWISSQRPDLTCLVHTGTSVSILISSSTGETAAKHALMILSILSWPAYASLPIRPKTCIYHYCALILPLQYLFLFVAYPSNLLPEEGM